MGVGGGREGGRKGVVKIADAEYTNLLFTCYDQYQTDVFLYFP